MPTFKELGLRAEIIRALDELGFEKPTPIQEKAIPHVLEQKTDLIALAQTGTGKTAAFGLPILEQIVAENRTIQCIVICPTRELCLQLAKDLESFAKFMDMNTVAVYGGASIENQIRALKRGAHFMVGTPGRTVDLINRGVLKLQHVNFVVLDEADEMLTMGFKDDLDAILAETPEEKRTLLFSATMPSGIRNIVGRYMHQPVEISAGQRNAGATNVEHQYYQVSARDKYECLKRVADVNPDIYGIVFCRTRRETKEIADKLMQDGYNADALHGDLSQAQRDTIMQRFRKRHLQILVATDVAARGLDVNDLTHIINYTLPDEEAIYIHRSGRTGRAGKSGISIAIIHGREKGKLKSVERKLKKTFKQQMVPTGKEICEKQLFAIVSRLGKMEIDEKQIDPFIPGIMEQLGELTREDLIKRLVAFEFNKFLEYYSKARDLNTPRAREDGRDRQRTGKRPDKRSDQRSERGPRDRFSNQCVDFSRFHLNLGRKDNVNAASLMGLINEHLSKRDVEIGKIEMMNTFCFFEIDTAYAAKLQAATIDSVYNGKKLKLSEATSTGPNMNAGKTKEKLKNRFEKRGGHSSSDRKKRPGRRPRRPF